MTEVVVGFLKVAAAQSIDFYKVVF